MSAGLLERIASGARERVARAKRREPATALARRAEAAAPARDFAAAVARPDRLNVIAEFKPASPTRGAIRPGADVAAVVAGYEAAGAAAVSVLTEPEFFGSGLDRLVVARRACGLPLLRKDFVVDAYQIDEARAAGADAVLLIVAMLDDAQLRDLVAAAGARGLAALVEAHDEVEVERALRSGGTLLGLNQRSLRTLTVDFGLAARLVPLVPRGVPVVAESGLTEKSQLLALREAGCSAFLIGTRLMEARSPGGALAELLR